MEVLLNPAFGYRHNKTPPVNQTLSLSFPLSFFFFSLSLSLFPPTAVKIWGMLWVDQNHGTVRAYLKFSQNTVTLLPLNMSEIKMSWLRFPLLLMMSYVLCCKSFLAVTDAFLKVRCSCETARGRLILFVSLLHAYVKCMHFCTIFARRIAVFSGSTEG